VLKKPMSQMSRRQLLTASGAAALLSKFPSTGRTAEFANVIVIGGGFSGLNAAIQLADIGAKVTVLEATNRPGGRALTGDHIEGRPEFGAEQIGPYYARIQSMAKRLGVTILPGALPKAGFALSLDGNLIGADAWESSKFNKTQGSERVVLPSGLQSHYISKHNPLTEVGSWLSSDAKALDISMRDWLKSLGASDQALQLINEGLVYLDIARLSTLRALHDATRASAYVKTMKQDLSSLNKYQIAALFSARIEGGTSRLPEAMAAHLGDIVRYNKIVSSISMTGTGVEVECLDRSRHRADFVVSAIPFTSLRRIDIDPPMVGRKAKAVENLTYHNLIRMYFHVKDSSTPYWEQDGLEPSLWTNGALNTIELFLDPDGSRNRILATAVGPKARRLDQLRPDDLKAYALKEIETLRPSMKGKIEFVDAHSWAKTPFISGCSHTFKAGEVNEFAREMIVPHERLHIAGEQTRRLEVGMESAMESGERVAIEIVNAAG